MRIRSIRSRLLAAIFTGSICVILLGVNFSYSLVKKTLYEELDHFLRDKLSYQQIAAIQTGERISFRLSEPLLKRLQDPEGNDFFQFRFLDGREIFRSSNFAESLDLPQVGKEPGDSEVGYDFNFSDKISVSVRQPSSSTIIDSGTNINGAIKGKKTLEDIPLRCMGIVFEPEYLDSELIQSILDPIKVHLVVAHDCTEIEMVLSELRTLLFTIGSVAVLFALLGTTVIIRRAMKPIGELSEKINQLNVSSIDESISIGDAPTEIYPIVKRVNELLNRISSTIEQERRFTANAAHELRNPLAGLRSQVELALTKGIHSEEDSDTLTNVLNIQRHMERVVENLLLLARLDSGSEELKVEEIPLALSLRRSWKQFFDNASDRRLVVEWNIVEPDISIKISPVLLDILVSNFFENAVNYAPEKGTIVINAEIIRNDLLLSIKNTNPGIEPSEIGALMQRFGRKDATFSSVEGHSGIGFSICRRIVSDHLKGMIKVDVDERWFAVLTRFPVSVVLGNHFHV